jgi:hypothetical protein
MGRGLIWLLLPVAATALLAAACGGGSTAATHAGVLGAGQPGPAAWATPAELRWLRRLGTWNARLSDGLAAVGDVERDPSQVRLLVARDPALTARTRAALAPASSCSSDFRTGVGPAPTQRLAAVGDAYLAACAHLERVAPLTAETVRTQDVSVLARANAEVEQGTALLARADDLVPPGERRPLPVVAGRSDASRIEPTLSRLVTELAGKSAEVRCWSRADWRRLLVEERAVSGGSIDDLTIGFANVRGTRANLSPEVCANLVSVVYERARPRDPRDVLALAASVVTIAHEAQHMRGVADEAVAECYGIQLARRTAIALGVERSYADTLVAAYWRHYPSNLPAYRSPECRDGGSLDLDAASHVFP